MQRHILHIGLPKTGTTALQRHYFPGLPESAVCYNPPHLLEPLIEAVKLLDFGMLREDDTQFLSEILAHRSKKIRQPAVLISLEILSQRLLKFDYRGRADFLKSIFPSATVVLILRYQPDLLRSLYQQQVRQNYFLPPEEVFLPPGRGRPAGADPARSSMTIDATEWDYTGTIEYYRELFGDRFHVEFFEDYNGNMVNLGRGILESVGLKGEHHPSPAPIPKTNVSYDSTTMQILLTLARRRLAFRACAGFDSRHMRGLEREADQARFLFDAPDRHTFRKRIRNRKDFSEHPCCVFDELLIKCIRKCCATLGSHRENRYELPSDIRQCLERVSKDLNSSLPEVVHERRIPDRYL